MIGTVFALMLVAQTPMTTTDVTSHARAASGRLDPSRAYREVVVEGEGTLQGTTVIDRHGSDYLAITNSGDFNTADGRISGQSWYQDANGVVFLSSGVHDATAVSGAEQSGSDVAVGEQMARLVHDGSHDFYMVERKRPDGLINRNYYNVTTFLLERSESIRRSGASSKTEYTDYRKIGNANVSFLRTWSDSIGNHGTTTIQSYDEIPVASAHIGVPQNTHVFSTPTAPVDLDATFMTSNHIIVPVTIHGHHMDFILDSGDAGGMTIDPGAAGAAGLTVIGRRRGSIAGALDVARTIADDVSIGGLKASHVAFSVVPIEQRYGYAKAVGLIGSDFFASNIVRIDYPHAKVTVLPPSSFDKQNAGTPVRVQLDDGWVRVPASFDGHRANLVLDTGSFATFLDSEFASTIGLGSPGTSDFETRILFLGGEVNAGLYDTKDIIFAGTQFKRGRVLVGKRHDPTATEGYDGLLGPDVFSAFAITFDYDNSLIYVK